MVKTFQFSVTMKDANPPVEVTIDGKLVLSDVVQAETMAEAINKLSDWLTMNNYSVYKPIRK